MTSMVALDKLKDYDRSAEVHNLVRDVDIEHRELMALAAKEIKRCSIDPQVEENAKLRDENDSLRELLRQMLGSCCRYHSCDWQCEHSYRESGRERCRLRDKAMDLGVY